MKSFAERVARRSSKRAEKQRSKRKKKSRPPKKLSPSRRTTPKTKKQAQSTYNTPEYKSWRTYILTRDKYTCQMCGSDGGRLEAHHIKPKARFPELTLDPNNGITLCYYCHRRLVTGKEENFMFIFSRIVSLNTKRK